MPLLRDAEQEQSYPILVEWRVQETGELAEDSDVSEVKWTLVDRDNNVINSRQNVAASAVASQTITLTGDDLPIADEANQKEMLIFTAIATIDGKPWAKQDEFWVENLRVVT